MARAHFGLKYDDLSIYSDLNWAVLFASYINSRLIYALLGGFTVLGSLLFRAPG